MWCKYEIVDTEFPVLIFLIFIFKKRNGHNLHKDECAVLKKRPLHNLTRLIYRLIKAADEDPDKYDLIDGEKRKLGNLMDRM